MAYNYDYGKTKYKNNFQCYYCEFTTDLDLEYQKHVEHNHPSNPVYPSIRQNQELLLEPQDKIWDNLGIEWMIMMIHIYIIWFTKLLV